MALTFPISPFIGQQYQSGSSNLYEWTGTYWKIVNLSTQNFVGSEKYQIDSASFLSKISQATNEGQFATTGSNTFVGNQIVSGGIYMGTGSIILPNGTEIYDIGGPGYSGIGLGNNGFGINFGSNINDWAQFQNATLIEMLPASGFNIRLGGNETGWSFNGSGMHFPDDTIQTTAFTGIPQGTVTSSQQITDLGFISSSNTIETGSFATTGSNTFVGNQIISGAVYMVSNDSEPIVYFGDGNGSVGLGMGAMNVVGNNYLGLFASGDNTSYITLTSAFGQTGFLYSDGGGIETQFSINQSGSFDLFANLGTASLLINHIPYDSHLVTTQSFNQYTSSVVATLPNGVISSSQQISDLGFITGSVTGSNVVGSNTVTNIETISSASYAALTPPVSGTLYIIIG